MITRPSCLVLLACLTVACGDPCYPTIHADTLLVAAPAECSDSAGATSGDVCDQSPALPWGPCNDDDDCDGFGVFCIAGQLGNVCAPSCAETCPDLGCAMAGECLPTGPCVPTCTSSSDCSDGMLCDAGVCVWPFPVDVCMPEPGELWGPCPDGACPDGECVGAPGGATLCAPLCGALCPPDTLCGTPSPAPLCQASGACGYACDSEHSCLAGQTCAGGICMWL